MEFARDVYRGLTSTPKSLPCKYLYDALGSALFEAICHLPEYYLTRAEAQILQHHAGDIVDLVGGPLDLIELGSGSALKTRSIISAMFERQPALRYRPIDISSSILQTSANALRTEYPGIVVDGVVADYLDGLRQMPRNGQVRSLALFLGSNIGNFDPGEAALTLRAVRDALRPGDGLLVGTDLLKDGARLQAAYDDPLGVTSAFNRNLLGRINRELGGHFDLKRFTHRAVFNPKESRVEMYLISDGEQTVSIDDLSLRANFCAGESIFTESSYKYDRDRIEALARNAGYELAKTWTDESGFFSSNLLLAR